MKELPGLTLGLVAVLAACGSSSRSGADAGSDGGNSPDCPAAEPRGGVACSPEGLKCTYGCGDAILRCEGGAWDVVQYASICTAPPACPTAAPNDGDGCLLPKNTTCTYGTCGVVTSATCDGSRWSVSKAGVLCSGDGGPSDAAAGVACGHVDDAGTEQPGACPGTQTCCRGGAVGTYYCTSTDGGACPAVP